MVFILIMIFKSLWHICTYTYEICYMMKNKYNTYVELMCKNIIYICVYKREWGLVFLVLTTKFC